jgi:hypothetical protein
MGRTTQRFRPIYLKQTSKRSTAVPQIEWERARGQWVDGVPGCTVRWRWRRCWRGRGCVRAPGCWRGWRYPTGPYFPAPRPKAVPSPRSAYPVPLNAGAFCRDLLPPCSHGKSAGIQARRGEGAGACSFDRFLPQGVTTRPLGEAGHAMSSLRRPGSGSGTGVSRADPHDRGDRGDGKQMAHPTATQGERYGGCCA